MRKASDFAALFAPLREVVARKNRQDGFPARHPWRCRLLVRESTGLLDVEYQGEYELWFDDAPAVHILRDLLRLLASADVAPALQSFTFRTPAVLAANGTYDYNIDPLVEGKQRFPKLLRLSLDQGEGEHGYRILNSPRSDNDWQEAGVLADLLAETPHLEELVTPGPPDAAFFKGRKHLLRSLDVDAGFGHDDFIRRLSACRRFPGLRHLVFTDFRQDYLDDWQEQATTFEDYVSFFESPIASRLESIRLREVSLTPAEVRRLLAIRREGVRINRHRTAPR